MPMSRDQNVDVRKSELLSAIPFVHRWLLKVELAPRLRVLLHQANLNWTAGGLMMATAVCLVIPAYLINLRTNTPAFAAIIGLAFGYAPLGYVLHRRAKRFDKFEQGLPEALDLMVSGLRAGHSLVARKLRLKSRQLLQTQIGTRSSGSALKSRTTALS